MNTILIPASPAELLDKISILQIKKERISDAEKLAHVEHELVLLMAEYSKLPQSPELALHLEEIKKANEIVWDSEEEIRHVWVDDAQVLAASRISHEGNDKRFQIKKKINDLLGSGINEVKSHQH
jgi:hypothetical protein